MKAKFYLTAGIAIIALLAGAYFWHTSAVEATYKRGYDVAMGEVNAKGLEAKIANQQIEFKRLERAGNAQNNRTTAQNTIDTDSAGLRAANNSLRDEIASLSNGGLPEESCAACTARADTAGELLGECAERYTAVAVKADGHIADIGMMQEAWPEP